MTATPTERVLCAVDGGVADVRLHRPDKLNALDPPLLRGLAEVADALAADRSVRAVVLSGAGRAFCAGLDLEVLSGLAGPAAATELGARPAGRATNLAQQAARAWAELPVPSIAAVHGVALGGGLQIALGADLRIVAPDARLSVLEVRWGLVPDMTGSWTLPRLVGPDVAKDLTWTGRTVAGQEAVRLGLATRLADDPRGAALELAHEIAASSPTAVRAAKALLDASLASTADDQFRRESATIAPLIGGPDQREAIAAYVEGRAPRFADP